MYDKTKQPSITNVLSNAKGSDLWKIVETLTDEKHKRRKTILTGREVPLLSTLDVTAQIYDIKFLKMWVDYYAEWKTSSDSGRGRQDIVEVAKSHFVGDKVTEELKNLTRGR